MKISPQLTKFALDTLKSAGAAVALKATMSVFDIVAEKAIDRFRPKEEVVEEQTEVVDGEVITEETPKEPEEV